MADIQIMKMRRTALLSLFAAMSVLLASCSLEPRNLGGPSAVGGTPPKHGMPGVTYEPESLTVSAVVPGSSAEEAQIVVGDRITVFDGQPVSNGNELQALIRKTKPETTVELQLTREDETRAVQVRLMSFTEWFNLRVKEQKRKNAELSE